MIVHGIARGQDELWHYVHSSSAGRHGRHWNAITWCSYELTPDTPSGINIRCYGQRPLLQTDVINCMRCAARTPGDPRPWG